MSRNPRPQAPVALIWPALVGAVLRSHALILKTILRRPATARRLLRNQQRWDATGLIRDVNELEGRGEGTWLRSPWEAGGAPPGTGATLDLDPHLLRLGNGRILARATDSAVYSASNRMLAFGASSFLRGDDDEHRQLRPHPFYRRPLWQRPFPWLEPPTQEEEPVFVLHSPWSHNNYYHFLMDLLPRLGLFLSCCPLEGRLPKIITTVSQQGYRAEVLARTGVPIVSRPAEPCLHLRAPALYVVALARTNQDVSPAAIRYLRHLFAPEITAAPAEPRRLLVLRGEQAKRPMRNEGELAEALVARGYEPLRLETLTVAEQARRFAAAAAVVAQHGAGLTNVAFCRPGTTVVELFNHRWHPAMHARISALAGARHLPIPCQGDSDLSLQVDVPALLGQLESLGLA